jgi:hypothetical protein
MVLAGQAVLGGIGQYPAQHPRNASRASTSYRI